MIKFDISVENVRQVIQSLKDDNKKMRRVVRKNLWRMCKDVVMESARHAPMDTGNLRRSRYVSMDSNNTFTPRFSNTRRKGKPYKGRAESMSLEHNKIMRRAKAWTRISGKDEIRAELGHSAFYAVKQEKDASLNHDIGQSHFFEQSFYKNMQPEKLLRGF